MFEALSLNFRTTIATRVTFYHNITAMFNSNGIRKSHVCIGCNRGYSGAGHLKRHRELTHCGSTYAALIDLTPFNAAPNSPSLENANAAPRHLQTDDYPINLLTQDRSRVTPGKAATSELYAGASASTPHDEHLLDTDNVPWWPFDNPDEFKLGRWFIESSTSKHYIDDYFHTIEHGRTAATHSVRSAHTLYNKLNLMDEPGLDHLKWETREVEWEVPNVMNGVAFFRNPVKVAEYLLQQPSLASKCHWLPQRDYNDTGERIYSEMHTANYWWRTQVGHVQLLVCHC